MCVNVRAPILWWREQLSLVYGDNALSLLLGEKLSNRSRFGYWWRLKSTVNWCELQLRKTAIWRREKSLTAPILIVRLSLKFWVCAKDGQVFTREYLAKNWMTIVEHPRYTRRIWLRVTFPSSPRLKMWWRANYFYLVEGLQAATSQVLKDLPSEAFSECYNAWQIWMLQCLNSGGKYFEGDHVDIHSDWKYNVSSDLIAFRVRSRICEALYTI